MNKRSVSILQGYRLLILILIITLPGHVFAQNVSARIKLNQLGYYPNAPKLAVVTGGASAGSFYITSTNLRDTLFTGTLGEEKQSGLFLH
jgi:endoglucanase